MTKKINFLVLNVCRYKIEKRLGSGNFGTAWLAIDLKCKEEHDI